MPATLSIMGLYNYDNTLFDLMLLPNGVDKDTLIDNLIAELAENEVLYPNAIVMKSLIGVWSTKRLKSWEKMYNTTTLDYDPISNYDRKEQWKDTTSGKEHSEGTANNTTTPNTTQTNKVAGYNSETLVNESENTLSGNTTVTGGGTNDSEKNETVTREGRAYGNIGVTTSQQMIEAERKVSEFDIYSYIISDFAKRFCLMIY